jgi:hypothetical protein
MKRVLPLLLIFSFFICISCDDVLECVILARSPELPDKTFQEGLVNTYYQDSFDAEISNEPRDNDYGYYFDFNGELPDGLHVYFDYRTVSIEGVTQIAGTFNFTIYLEVDPPLNYDEYSGEYEEDMCSTTTSKEYTITINYQ